MTLGAAAPASADFHPACLNFAGDARVNLTAQPDGSGQSLVYSMTVFCDEADSVTINPLTLTNFFGSIDISSVTIPGKTCLGESCSLEGRAPATMPGLYRVSGSFSTTGHDVTFTDVPRCGRWTWLSFGQPSVISDGGNRACD